MAKVFRPFLVMFGIGLISITLLAGCGKRTIYPVSGQIVDKQGNPIPGIKGYSVEFKSLDNPTVSASGAADDKGNFKLGTETPGDGAYLGKHQVIIVGPRSADERARPQVIDPKYESFETSGLTATVEPKSNVIKLEVELYKP
jgi:hypothetical protein